MPALPMPPDEVLTRLRRGTVIPAHPLALTAERKLDERRQRALSRYYLDAGAGGLAVGVHTTQFEIRDAEHDLLRPVLELARQETVRHEAASGRPAIKIAGICGQIAQAASEAQLATELGYDAGLLSLAALKNADDDQLIEHCRQVSRHIAIVGFYLQPSVGGRALPFGFWRRFAEIENVVAIKIAPFNRYQTIDVIRAVAEAGRAPTPDADSGIALYTGNDDEIITDLLGQWTFDVGGEPVSQRIVGGLLGHWACWTKVAVELLRRCHAANASGTIPAELLALNRQVTDMNAAVFDVAHGFAGCIAGVHEVLRRQGLLEGVWCLNPTERLSPGQAEELTRVSRAYPHLTDDAFVADNLARWLR